MSSPAPPPVSTLPLAHAPAGAFRQRDAGLVVVLTVSSILGLLGLAATALLGVLGLLFVSEIALDTLLWFVLSLAVAVVGIGGGYWLLRGYWRIRSGVMPAANRSRFWRWSAAYNGVGLLIAAAGIADRLEDVLSFGLDLGIGVAVLEEFGIGLGLWTVMLAWTGWMAWISMERARPESAPDFWNVPV